MGFLSKAVKGAVGAKVVSEARKPHNQQKAKSFASSMMAKVKGKGKAPDGRSSKTGGRTAKVAGKPAKVSGRSGRAAGTRSTRPR